jgi:hypothetical protein
MKRILILFFLFLTLGCTYYETQDDGGAIIDTNSTYHLRVSEESDWSTVITIQEEGVKTIGEIELVGDYRVLESKDFEDFIYLRTSLPQNNFCFDLRTVLSSILPRLII